MGLIPDATAEELLRDVADRLVDRVDPAIPGLESGEARDLQRRINKQLDACGCSEAGVGLLAAIGGALALWRVDWLPVHGWAVAVSAVAVWASGSGCGPREGCRASAGPAGLADYELFGRHTAGKR